MSSRFLDVGEIATARSVLAWVSRPVGEATLSWPPATIRSRSDPDAILAEILPGLKASGVRFQVEADRTRAIHIAIAEARENDVVVIAGKGHEKVQILRDQTIPFDDAEEARQSLLERYGESCQDKTEARCN